MFVHGNGAQVGAYLLEVLSRLSEGEEEVDDAVAIC